MKVRDSKRQALYNSEIETFRTHEKAEFTLAEAQAWLDAFIKQRWFQQRWKIKSVQVRAGRNGGWADYWGMTLGVKARNRHYILHELAHVIMTREIIDHAPHGSEFAATLLLLIDHEFGRDVAGRLREEFSKRNVKYRWTGAQREARYQVATQAQEREKRTAKAKVPPSLRERQQAAETLRQAVSAGLFGPAGSKPRLQALATARALEKVALAA